MKHFAITINDGPMLDCFKEGISLHTLTEANNSEGSLQLSVVRHPSRPFLLSAGTGLTPPDLVTVYRDGQVILRGPAGVGKKTWNGSELRHLHVVHNPWTVVENCQFSFWYLDTLPTFLRVSSAAWLLLKQWCDNRPTDIGKWLQLPLWPKTVPQANYDVWPNTTGPLSTSITNLFKPFSLVATRWDYSTTPPTLRPYNVGDQIITLDQVAHGIDDVEMSPRYDLLPSSVQLWNIASEAGFGSMQPVQPMYTDPMSQYPLGVTTGGYKSVSLVQPPISATQLRNGAAQALFDGLSQLIWEGSFKVNVYDLGFDIRPGMTIRLTGRDFDPAWATMNAVVQSVSTDIMTGVASVTLGANGHVSVSDMMDRVRWQLYLKPWNFMGALDIAHRDQVVTTPGAGLGDDASATTIAEVDVALGGTLRVIAQVGSQNLNGSTFVDIALPSDYWPAGYTITLTPDSGVTTTLAATATLINRQLIRISQASNAPVAGTVLQWTITINPS